MAGKAGNMASLAVYLLLGFVVFGLGGYGVVNFGGSVRSIGAVGETEISVNEYARELQQTLTGWQRRTGQSVTLASPEGQALAQFARRQLVARAALENEAAALGLSIGDEAVAEALMSDPNFTGLDGKFSPADYDRVLNEMRMTPVEFEARLRRQGASQLLAAAALSGIEAPAALVDPFAAYLGERRDILWLKLGSETLATPLPAPTEAELQATWEADPAAYTLPERRRITYVALTPETLRASVTVDEAEVRALFDQRADEYSRPERRLVERLVMPDAAAAAAARTALDGGQTTFEDLVAERGLDLADIDMGDVTRAQLGPAGEAVFALDGPGIAGPVETSLGPTLFRVNAVLAAQSTPYEEAREALADEVAVDRARRQIGDLREGIDDMLAGGATLEDVAAETEMDLDTLEFSLDSADGIAAYPAFREAAARVATDDYPEVLELEDGGLFALRLDAVLPPALQPLEDVRDQVLADWEAAETEARLIELGETIREARATGQSYEDLAHTPQPMADLGRQSYLDGAPDGLIGAVFGLDQGGIVVLPGDGMVHLAEVTRITPEDPQADESRELRGALEDQVAQGMAQDILDLFIAALGDAAGITTNPAAIEAVHSQIR